VTIDGLLVHVVQLGVETVAVVGDGREGETAVGFGGLEGLGAEVLGPLAEGEEDDEQVMVRKQEADL
jgi:hypothetical protein